jgi:hypothetical protein
VTLEKLDTSGASNGEVITYTSGGISWQTPVGLSLPYSGSASPDGPAFDVTNPGSGSAVRGSNGQGDYALLGDVNGYGVKAYSRAPFGAGLLATHTSGNTAWLALANVGVLAQHTSGNVGGSAARPRASTASLIPQTATAC